MLDQIPVILLVLQILVFIYFILVNGAYTLFTIISLKDIKNHLATISRQELNNIMHGVFYRPLSIIVPAYNEEKTIVSTVKSLLMLKYPEYEVIVVNDGSVDRTLDLLISEFHLFKVDKPIEIKLKHQPIDEVYISILHPNLTILCKKNGGKSDALNAGINASQFPLFCSIDADSLLESDALLRAAKLFVEDREVIATGGIIRVLNGCTIENGIVTEVRAPKKMLECFQAVEYTRGFLAGRTAWSFFGSLLIISGAFAIFRKDLVIAIQGYRESVGEDMDIVVRLHKYCRENKVRYKVLFVPDPVCWTQAPTDVVSLLKQRNRWHRGLFDSLWKSRKMFLNPKYREVGLLGYPYFLFIEALGPVIEFMGYCLFIVYFLLGLVNPEFILLFLFLAIIWGMYINLGSIILDNLVFKRYRSISDLLKLSLYGAFEFLGYRQLMVVERVIATLFCWRTQWDKPKRREIESETSKQAAQ